MAFLVVLQLALCSGFAVQGVVGGSFLGTAVDAEKFLAAELASGRLAALEALLQPIYEALPKDANGHLGHQAVRFAVHRLFVKRRGWQMKGLEPTIGESSTTNADWLPAYLQGLLEKRVGEHGVDVHGLAAFAAALEDVIRKEADDRLEEVYQHLDIPTTGESSAADVKQAVVTYLMTYIQGGDFSAVHKLTPEQVADDMVRVFGSNTVKWSELQAWLTQQWESQAAAGNSTLDFVTAQHVAESIGEHFSDFNDHECSALKEKLISMEDKMPGRVPMKDFYVTGLLGQWPFTQKIEYLRSLGALDETNPASPRLIVPNYLESQPHCLDVSGLYSICCRNECEGLMGQIEEQTKAPSATPEHIAEFVGNLSSNTVTVPRTLSASLLGLLDVVAAEHGGRVVLHSRLFAQWMHHAFPRECPYPHEAGATGTQTPDEWLAGEEEPHLSDMDMLGHVGKFVCLGNDCDTASKAGDELPWTTGSEKLLAPHEHHYPAPPARVRRSMSAFAMVLAAIALVAVGVRTSYKSSMPAPPTKKDIKYMV